MIGRVGVSRGVGRGGVEGERLAGGCTTGGDEDLVRGESEVGLGEMLRGELAEGRLEIVGDGIGFGRHSEWWWWCGFSLGVTKREVSE